MAEDYKEGRTAWLFAGVLLLILYAGLILLLDQMPFMDLANHVTRTYIIAQQVKGTAYSEMFQYHFRLQPYILGDLVLASFHFVFSFRTVAVLYPLFLFCLWIGAVMLYARQRGVSGSRLLWLFLLSPWLATNYFYICGFANWILSSALALLALAFLETFCKSEHWIKFGGRIVIFSFLLVLVYLVHLAPVVILVPVVMGVILGWYMERREGWWKGLVALVVLGAIMLGHLVMGHLGGSAGEIWGYLPWWRKILRLSSMFARYNFAIDGLFFFLIIGSVAPLLLMTRGFSWRKLARFFGPSLGALGAYFVLPAELGPATDVDTRATLFIVVLGIVALLQFVNEDAFRTKGYFLLAFLVSLGNLLYLAFYLVPANRHLEQHLALLEGVPRGEKVFTVSTRREQGRLHFSFHPPETAIVERQLMIPYLFTANLSGEQLSYFVCQHPLYIPGHLWYVDDKSIDWVKVRRSYSYLLVEKPFEMGRLDSGIVLVSENSSGALFAFR